MSCDFENASAETRPARGPALWALTGGLASMLAGGALLHPWRTAVWPDPAIGPLAIAVPEAATLLMLAGLLLAALSARALWRALATARTGAARADDLLAMIEHDQAARLLLNAAGGVLAANAQARRLWPSLDPVAETRTRLFDPRGLAGLEEGGERLERLAAAARAGQDDRATLALSATTEAAGTTPDEPEWWDIALRVLPGRPTDPDTPRRLWVAHDVTARRAIDEVLTGEREALSDHLFFLPVGLYTADTEGRLRFINQRLVRWLDRSAGDLSDVRLADIVDGPLPPPGGRRLAGRDELLDRSRGQLLGSGAPGVLRRGRRPADTGGRGA